MPLFKKKKKKKAEAPQENTAPPVEDMASETLIEEKDIQNILGDVMKSSGMDEITERLDDLSRKIDEFQSRIERHDSLISSMENELSEMRKVNEEIQDNIKRLLDVYEIVSQKINPFVNMQEPSSTGIQEITGDTIVGETNVVSVPNSQEIPRVMEQPEPSNVFQEFPQVERQSSESRQATAMEHNENKKTPGAPILTHIRKDYYTIVLLMRWIEFLFERVKRDKITLLLDYYVDIGWISKSVKSEIMAYARGEVQDVTKYFPEEEIEAEIETPEGTIKTPPPHIYRKVEDWRLSAEDHLKSLLFIMKIAGEEVNKDRLNSLEQEIEKFKKSLWEFHGV